MLHQVLSIHTLMIVRRRKLVVISLGPPEMVA
jgi:hypothetical protein